MNFEIYSPFALDSGYGGVCALYQLAAMLEQRGYPTPVTLTPHMAHPGVGLAHTVAIVPECYPHNPSPYRNVVRWYLNNSPYTQFYADNELSFTYSRTFDAPTRTPLLGQLFTTNFRTDVFYDRHLARSGTCYLIRKCGGGSKPAVHPADALCLDDYNARGGHAYLAEVFNTFEHFISYDHSTYINAYAAMCGIETVIIPDGTHSIEQRISQCDLQMAGMAWGFEDVPRARATLPDLPNLILASERASWTHLDAFLTLIDTHLHDQLRDHPSITRCSRCPSRPSRILRKRSAETP